MNHIHFRSLTNRIPPMAPTLAIAIVVAGASFGATRAVTARGDGAGPSTDATYTEIGGKKPPTISTKDAARAEALARAYPAVATMLKAGNARVQAMPWIGFDQKPIGAVVEFDLDSPASGTLTLPIADYRADLESASARPYDSYTVEVSAESIKGFYVQVNLRTDEVANVMPKEGSKILLTTPRPDLERKGDTK